MSEFPQGEQPEQKNSVELTPESVEKKIFDVSKFLVEPAIDYGDLIRKNEKDSKLEELKKDTLFTSYGFTVAETLNPEGFYSSWGDEEIKKKKKGAFDFFKGKIQGKILVDLGAGRTKNMARLAQKLGAKVYIRVDKFYPTNKDIKLDPSKDLSYGVKIKGETQVVVIKADILDFISRLPSDSVCITINGIDKNMVESDEYDEALSREIVRVISQDGIAFGVGSDSVSRISNVTIPKFSTCELFIKK